MTTRMMDKCPICHGELQATQTRLVYFVHTAVEINDKGKAVRFDLGVWKSDDDGECNENRVYCENDHTLDEMLAAFNAAGEKEVRP